MNDSKIIYIDKTNINNILKIIKKNKNKSDVIIESKIELSNEEKQLVECFNIKDKIKRIEYIYDVLCKYIDDDMEKNNYCDFKDGLCIANRLGKSVHKDNGCCYNNSKLCESLIDGKCTTPNPSCKIFMCSYLNKKKNRKNYNTRKINITSIFLTNYDHLFFKMNYFISKKEFIRKYTSKVV